MKSRLISGAAGVIASVTTCLLLGVAPAEAQLNLLFVSDSTTDTNIPTALQADGHTVTVVTGDFATGNATLQGDLSAFHAVFWSSTGGGSGDIAPAAALTNLTNYVTAGGDVFVTGYDSIASPDDPSLLAFIGASSDRDISSGPGPGPVANIANNLTVGVVDIRGVTPTGFFSDLDDAAGLLAGTVGVASTSNDGINWQWTLRTLGAGNIAYVSNGASAGNPNVASWTTPGNAYNGALRNFAFNSAVVPNAAAPEPSTLAFAGMGALTLAGCVIRRRRR